MRCKISWHNYIANTLNESHELYDNLSFENEPSLPFIIKACKHIQSRLNEKHQNSIFIAPEAGLSSCILSVINAISCILSGKNKGVITNLEDFEPDTKIRALGCTVLFKGVEIGKDGAKRVRLTFKDKGSARLYKSPYNLPVFQKSEGKLTSADNWDKHYNKWKVEESSDGNDTNSLLAELKNKKSFLNGSVVYICNIQKTKSILTDAKIEGQDLRDILVIKYLMKDGDTKALKGVVSGIPPLLLVSNINQVTDLIQSGSNILGVIIDYSQKSDSFIERLKTILRHDIPISIFMTPSDSIDNIPNLSNLGFKIWKWDKYATIAQMHNGRGPIEKAISNVWKGSVKFIPCSAPQITKAFEIANKYKVLVDNEEFPDQICSIYSDYVGLLYDLMRAINPVNDTTFDLIKERLAESSTIIKNSKISDEMISDMDQIAQIIISVADGMSTAKGQYIEDTILQNKDSDLLLILPSRTPRQDVISYYRTFCLAKNIHPRMHILQPRELNKVIEQNSNCIVIVPAWLDKKTMKDIILSYHFSDIRILITEYESKWASSSIRFWNRELNDCCNKGIIDTYISTDEILVDGSCFSGKDILDKVPSFETTTSEKTLEEPDSSSDISDIEQYFRSLRYRKYRSHSSGNTAEAITEALPVEYTDDKISFYIPEHELIVCVEDDESIQVIKKTANTLNPGDAVAIRKDNNDLIKAVADIALKEQNEKDARELASYFQDLLLKKVSNIASFRRKLNEAGYDISYAAVLSWINKDEFIGVQKKEALYAVAEVLNSDFLRTNAEKIFNAAELVKNAHRQAGRVLSNFLNDYLQKQKLERIPTTLSTEEYGEIEFHIVDNVGNLLTIERSRLNHIQEKEV